MCLVPAPVDFWASRNDFSNFAKISPAAWYVFLTSFAKNESLYRRISTKYKSSKLFWRILEDDKQNKRENRGKKTVWILRGDSRLGRESAAHVVQTQWIPSRLAFASLFAINSLLILMNYISEFMFACFNSIFHR